MREQILDFNMRVEKFANPMIGDSRMKDVEISFEADTKGSERIENWEGDTPKYIQVFTDAKGNAFDFVESITSTPPMIHKNDTWIKICMAKAIEKKLTPDAAAKKYGVPKETAVDFYKYIMLENSVRAIHNLHGCVNVFVANGWQCYFIFDQKKKLLCNEKFGQDNFKCPPILEN